MKVLLFDIESGANKKCVNKDLAGGMGTGTWIGDSFRARVLEFAVKKNVVIPVLATAYLSAIFKNYGWQVELIRISSTHIPKLPKANLALVPITMIDYKHELDVVKKIKSKRIHIGVYGTFATAMPELFVEEVDFIIKGEPEIAALKIAAEKKLPRGIVEDGVVEDLDKLPFPDWSMFPIKKYSYSPALNKKPVLIMLASRGCPYSCSCYCPYPLSSGKKWRMRSVENVVEEIVYLKKEYGIRAIDFRDPVFTLDQKRARDLSEKMIEKNLNIIWSCETRLDCLNKELLKIMYKAGLRNLNVGIESSCEDVLKNSKRLPIERDHQEGIIDFCRKTGITVAAFYILGLENDTKETIEKTIKYAQKLNTLTARFGVSTPYPGTLFFKELKENGSIMEFDFENYDGFTPVFRHKFLSAEELLFLKEKAFVSYYFRVAYILRHMPKYIFQKFLWPF